MKSRKWIKEKYFDSIEGRHWVFSGQVGNQEGNLRRLHLESAAKTAIQRHVKIKGETNPYDAKWESYLEHRLGVKMAATLRGRRALFNLWREQQGRCLICQEKITRLTGWHNHHLVWRGDGGTDGAGKRARL